MDTFESKQRAHIVPLTAEEIAAVNGGKATEPTRSYLERFSDWLGGGADFPPRIPLSDLSNFEAATLNAGGEFFHNASMLIQVMRADGTCATIQLV